MPSRSGVAKKAKSHKKKKPSGTYKKKKPHSSTSKHKKSHSSTSKHKKSTRSTKTRGTKKTGGAHGPTVGVLQKQAKRLGIPLSRDGKKKTKSQLKRAIEHHA